MLDNYLWESLHDSSTRLHNDQGIGSHFTIILRPIVPFCVNCSGMVFIILKTHAAKKLKIISEIYPKMHSQACQ